MIEEVISREGFGDDPVPDLLFVNFKAIDHVSHIWSANSPEMQDTLSWQDEDLGRFVEFLDREVGKAGTCSCSPPTTARSSTRRLRRVPGDADRARARPERGLPAGGGSVFQAVRRARST